MRPLPCMRPAIHHATGKEGEYAAEGNEQAETSPQKSNKSPPQSPSPTQSSIVTELAKQQGCNQPRRPVQPTFQGLYTNNWFCCPEFFFYYSFPCLFIWTVRILVLRKKHIYSYTPYVKHWKRNRFPLYLWNKKLNSTWCVLASFCGCSLHLTLRLIDLFISADQSSLWHFHTNSSYNPIHSLKYQ